MTEAGQDQLMYALRVGELAAALTYDLELTGDVEFQELASLPPYALVAADHPLAARAEVTLADLAELPLVMLDLPLSRDYFRDLFLMSDLEPKVVQRSPHIEVVRALVGNGFGYTILNARSPNGSALDGRPLASVRIAGPTRPMTVGLATLSMSRRTRVTQAFEAHCRRAMANHEIPALEP